MNFSKNWATILISSAIILFYLPKLFSQGMFLDGIVYASISRNMALGIGDFFHPSYIPFKHFIPYFSEHLSLTFYLESFFFKVFGDHYWVENVYSIFVLLFSIFLMRLECKNLVKDKESPFISPIVILLFMTSPVIIWTYSNNMLEGTMLLFCISSNIFYLKAHSKRSVFYSLIASVFLLLAFFSKGVTALFPLMTPFYLYILDSKDKRNISIALSGLLLPLILFSVFYVSIPPLNIQVNAYFNQQIVNTLLHQNAVNHTNRLNILVVFCSELGIVLGLTILLVFLTRNLKVKLNFQLKEARLPFLIGLSALLPLCMSLRQHAYYVVPAIYYVILGLVILFRSHLEWLKFKLSNFITPMKWMGFGFSILFGLSMLISWKDFGGYRRDGIVIQEVKKMANVIPRGSILGYESTNPEWTKLAYLHRLNRYSIQDVSSSTPHKLSFSQDSQSCLASPIFNGEFIQVCK